MLQRLNEFRYIEPKSINEALNCLDRYADSARFLAGGTDLLVHMKEKIINPQCLINLKCIKGLDYIRTNENGELCIGALTTIRQLETSPLIHQNYFLLREAAGVLGSVQVRNRATAAGNLCNAAPSADLAPALLALDSRVRIVGLRGERIIPINDFFVGPGKTVLDKEMLVEIIIPSLPENYLATYIKYSPRRAMDLAVVGVAVLISFDKQTKRVERARVALGAVAPTPFRAVRAEAFLSGKKVSADLPAEGARIAAEEARPISDIRGSAEYRREMIITHVRRALDKLFTEGGINNEAGRFSKDNPKC